MKKKPKERPSALFQIRTKALVAGNLLATACLGQGVPSAGFSSYHWSNLLLPVAFGILVAIFLNALFVAGDTSIDLLRSAHIKALERENGGYRVLQEIFDKKTKYVSTCTLGSQTMRAWMIILSFLAAPALAERLVGTWPNLDIWSAVFLGGIIISVPVAALNLVLGELVPRSYAVVHPGRTALRLNVFVRVLTFVFGPPGKVVMSIASLVTRRFGGKASFAVVNPAEEEIKNLVESAQETGEIEVDEKELLHSVFEFTDTIVREVMTPRVDMDAVSVANPPSEVVDLIQTSGHSRIPVYEETDDQIVGIVHAKDILMSQLRGEKRTLRELMRPALFVPENKILHELLREMRSGRTQMAIVQDEFGGTAGIVTIEDIVEELVGEIVDEYDIEEPEVVPNGAGVSVGGKMNLYDLNDEIGSSFQSEEFDTVAGYVFGLFGRQPKKSESIESEGYRFLVEETDGRRIIRLHIEPVANSQDQIEATHA